MQLNSNRNYKKQSAEYDRYIKRINLKGKSCPKIFVFLGLDALSQSSRACSRYFLYLNSFSFHSYASSFDRFSWSGSMLNLIWQYHSFSWSGSLIWQYAMLAFSVKELKEWTKLAYSYNLLIKTQNITKCLPLHAIKSK